MSNLSDLFSDDRENENSKNSFVSREKYQNIKNDFDDLSFIEESLLKLELINLSRGETEYLTNQLSSYQNKLEEIKKEYSERKKENSILKPYDEKMDYLFKLSTLADEIEIFSKIWFYFDELDKKLQEGLWDSVLSLLKKEVALIKYYEFHIKLGKNQLIVEREYLKKLVEKIKATSYIQKYLKENDIVIPIFINETVDITVPERDQIFGPDALEIFQKRGTKAIISDYAILSGGNFYDGYQLRRRTGYYWTKTYIRDKGIGIVNQDGEDSYTEYGDKKYVGVRPILPFSSIYSICKNSVKAQDGILETEYGEYPQQAAEKGLQKILEELFQNHILRKVGKKYIRGDIYSYSKEPQEIYEYQEKKYIRSEYFGSYYSKIVFLSNAEQYQAGEYAWVEVQPIKWLVDQKNDIAIAEKILFIGALFYNYEESYKGDFENTDLKWYLDTYFSKEIIPDTNLVLDYGKEKILKK